ncbi:MAG: NAD kinase [Haemophilus parainfluenzae]|jgi:probable inorganic polyphosphate/ATP-NAD kinase|nr:MAG: NAD kinase [Haemophilus parainfluenzae]
MVNAFTPNRVGLVLRKNTPSLAKNARTLIEFLLARGRKVMMDQDNSREIENELGIDLPSEMMRCPLLHLGKKSEVIIVLGGDGTLLTVGRFVAKDQVPLIGINRGRLGFLTQLPWGDTALADIEAILSGERQIEERHMLTGQVLREGKVISKLLAVNEIAIGRGAQGKLMEFEVFVNGSFVYTQLSDGLIVSTPTGSTAYSLAAGGPILSVTLPAINIVPICAQSLTNRPIVLNDHAKIEILIIEGQDSMAHFDGHHTIPLRNLDRLQIECAKEKLILWQSKRYDYFGTLREKLRWGEQLV